jgi:hypothetical protein
MSKEKIVQLQDKEAADFIAGEIMGNYPASRHISENPTVLYFSFSPRVCKDSAPSLEGAFQFRSDPSPQPTRSETPL